MCASCFYVASTSRFCHEQHYILFEVFLLFYVRLQDGVPDTIAALREAGIKVGANFKLYSTVENRNSFKRNYDNIDWQKL